MTKSRHLLCRGPHHTLLGIALSIVGLWPFFLWYPFLDGHRYAFISRCLKCFTLGSSPSSSTWKMFAEIISLQCRSTYRHPNGVPLTALSIPSPFFYVWSFLYYHQFPDNVLGSLYHWPSVPMSLGHGLKLSQPSTSKILCHFLSESYTLFKNTAFKESSAIKICTKTKAMSFPIPYISSILQIYNNCIIIIRPPPTLNNIDQNQILQSTDYSVS